MILSPILENYLAAHTTEELPVLAHIARQTHLKVLKANMLSGHSQGVLLQILSKIMQPKLIVEIGSYTGYSAVCLAQGLPADGVLHTIEGNEELETLIRTHLELANVHHQTVLHMADAKNIIPALSDGIDLAFIDADKKSNLIYLNMLVPKMRSGGLILIDNVLWKGKVLDLHTNTDKDTTNIHNDNVATSQISELISTILPIRDGLFMAVKK